MPRKFDHHVSTTMVKIVDGEGHYLLRQPTVIHFGNGKELLGSVCMTNPGSFKFDDAEWTSTKDKQLEVATSIGRPDTTMRNVIRVITEAYSRSCLGEPSGIVRIHNISNIREPDSGEVQNLHETVKQLLTRRGIDINLLEDPVTNDVNHFEKMAEFSPFIIMGFVRKAFSDKATEIAQWAEKCQHKTVAALDNLGWLSHPFRWNIDEDLREQAIGGLSKVLMD